MNHDIPASGLSSGTRGLGFKGYPHVNPIPIASTLLIAGGFILLSAAWRVLYRAQRDGTLRLPVPMVTCATRSTPASS